MTLSIAMLCHYAECHYAECRNLIIIMLNDIMLSVIMLNGVILCFVMLPITTCMAVSDSEQSVKTLQFKLRVCNSKYVFQMAPRHSV
jgi:hypothetical protein